jgi:zinc/manganese transport system substrate-binding protein
MPGRAPRHSLLLLTALAVALAGCGSLPPSAVTHGVRVVAAENFWGSIARQLGGSHAQVTSIIANPAQDPHAYEPTAGDARAVATAQLAVVNGIGYDPWATRLLSADSSAGRVVVNVGAVVRLHQGDNPHRWYDPADVDQVAAAITRALQRLDRSHAAAYAHQLNTFEARKLGRYHALIAAINHRYAGVAVGASESILAPLAKALGLRLLTPPSFLRAISEGTELTAQETATAETQITARKVKLWVYNAQNGTPEIQRLTSLARSERIPVVTVTETLSPRSDSFEQWQVAQLQRLAAALHRATGR